MLLDPAGIELATSWSPIGCASDWATEAGIQNYLYKHLFPLVMYPFMQQLSVKSLYSVLYLIKNDKFTKHPIYIKSFKLT